MTRILFAGDVHGNLSHVRRLLAVAIRERCDRIVQLGDFGYWPHMSDFDDEVAELSAKAGIAWYWLDGNHENFDALEDAVDMASPVPVLMANGLTYLPRGCTWEWDGVRFMAFGGGYSIDKQWRVEGSSWWPQELPTRLEQERALEATVVDVLLTHDAPEGTCPIINPGYKGDEISSANRRWITELATTHDPDILIHGHYHHRYSADLDGIRVEGLDCDENPDKSWLVLDLAAPLARVA